MNKQQTHQTISGLKLNLIIQIQRMSLKRN